MISLLLVLMTSLFLVGLINKSKGWLFAGRKGAPVLQPFRDVIRLLRKGSVYSNTTSFIFKIAPSIYLATILTAALMVPFGTYSGLLSFNCDFILFAYILGLGKFFIIISAMDTGSSFEGMGASREAFFSILAEPTFFIIIGTIAILTGYTSFAQIFDSLNAVTSLSPLVLYSLSTIGAIVFFILGMIENCRMPVDDPKTHLELTMIHEVMILDNSGFDLGLISGAGLLKFSIYSALAANFFLVARLPLYLNLAIFFGVQLVYALAAGLVESFMARFRINQNPQIIFSLSSIAILLYIGVMVLMGRFY
jgi:formate hydrogenlyase subunit 4